MNEMISWIVGNV